MYLWIHWFMDSLVHEIIGSVTQLCMDSFMSCHWHLNHHFLICWSTSQLQPFMASASQKRSYRPLISYSDFLFSKLPPRRGPGTIWYSIFKKQRREKQRRWGHCMDNKRRDPKKSGIEHARLTKWREKRGIWPTNMGEISIKNENSVKQKILQPSRSILVSFLNQMAVGCRPKATPFPIYLIWPFREYQTSYSQNVNEFIYHIITTLQESQATLPVRVCWGLPTIHYRKAPPVTTCLKTIFTVDIC